MRGDIAVDFSVGPVLRTSVPFLLKFFCLLISPLVFIGLLLFFYIQLPKDIGNTFPGYFFIVNLGVLDLDFFTKFWGLRFLVKVFEYGYISVTINDIAFIFYIQLPKDLSNTFLEKKNYCKFRRFRLRFVYKISFQSASNLEMCCWIAFKLHRNICHHICYSIPTIFSENFNL